MRPKGSGHRAGEDRLIACGNHLLVQSASAPSGRRRSGRTSGSSNLGAGAPSVFETTRLGGVGRGPASWRATCIRLCDFLRRCLLARGSSAGATAVTIGPSAPPMRCPGVGRLGPASLPRLGAVCATSLAGDRQRAACRSLPCHQSCSPKTAGNPTAVGTKTVRRADHLPPTNVAEVPKMDRKSEGRGWAVAGRSRGSPDGR